MSCNAELSRDDSRGLWVITGDHDRSDTGTFRLCHCLFGPLARRINHANKPEKHEFTFDGLIEAAVVVRGLRQRTKCDAERAQSFTGKLVIAGKNFGAALGRQWPWLFSEELVRATRK